MSLIHLSHFGGTPTLGLQNLSRNVAPDLNGRTETVPVNVETRSEKSKFFFFVFWTLIFMNVHKGPKSQFLKYHY